MSPQSTSKATAGDIAAADSRVILRVEGVRVVLSGREVLQDVSFELRTGELTGLIGANGAGKTTLLRVILGLQRTDGGKVEMSAQTGRRRAIGYVPQKIVLDPDLPMRARDMVRLGLDGHRMGISLPSRARQAEVEEMLDAVGALPFADTRVGRLSGGELQRVLIAHALASRPPLLLLDEPLANLDLGSTQEVVGLLDRVRRERQVAILLSAHEMNPLLPVMDRVVYLAAGRSASGTTAEVVRSDVLSNLYGHHVDVLHVHGRVVVVAEGPGDPGHCSDDAAQAV